MVSDSPVPELGVGVDDTSNRSQDVQDPAPPLGSSGAYLPVLRHAATARESDGAKEERLRGLGGSWSDTRRVRYAPPPVQSTATAIVFPRLMDSVKHETETVERRRLIQAMEAELGSKQTQTARFFQVLSSLHQQSTSSPMKALLQQITSALLRAAYQIEGELAVEELDSVTLAELLGSEYVSLFTHAQLTLENANQKKQQLETELEMERALEQDLLQVLVQLDRDLHVIRTQHLENHERVEAERRAVLQLEQEHEALLHQEQQLRKECDGLVIQADKQKAQLQELHNKSAYLEFISRIPIKKHLEQKKSKEQEEALAAIVQKEEAENQRLEDELQKLNEQIAALDGQFNSDVAHRAALGIQLVESEHVRDATQVQHQRVRDCHTPRPSWDAILEKIPELSNDDDVEWDELQAAQGDASAMMLRRAQAAAKLEGGNQTGYKDEDGDADDDEDVRGQTQQLVKEILQWIERLQKHCGVNLHLSRIWHDVEEARVELNVLQQQLDRAMRKHAKYSFNVNRGKADASPTKPKPRQEYICALGIHEEVPLFLRHQGKVKRHPLKKGELEALVRKVWTEKRQREKRNPHLRLPLEEVLYEKLHRKYGFQPLIAEWGYNILISLDMYAWDAELELFLLCLTHAISDAVYLDQERMLDMCMSLMLKLSESYSNESFVTERRVLLKDALVAMRKFFPLKTSSQLQALEKAMIRDMHKMKRGGNDSILYIEDILPRNVSYPRGFFVKAIRSQHFKEVQEYYSLLVAELDTRDEHKRGEFSLRQVHEAMLAVDPLADHGAVWSALMRGTGVKTRAQLEMHDVVPYKPLLRKMNCTGLLKFALNYDVNAELNWQRRGSIDLSVVAASGKEHSSLSARSQGTSTRGEKY